MNRREAALILQLRCVEKPKHDPSLARRELSTRKIASGFRDGMDGLMLFGGE